MPALHHTARRQQQQAALIKPHPVLAGMTLPAMLLGVLAIGIYILRILLVQYAPDALVWDAAKSAHVVLTDASERVRAPGPHESVQLVHKPQVHYGVTYSPGMMNATLPSWVELAAALPPAIGAQVPWLGDKLSQVWHAESWLLDHSQHALAEHGAFIWRHYSMGHNTLVLAGKRGADLFRDAAVIKPAGHSAAMHPGMPAWWSLLSGTPDRPSSLSKLTLLHELRAELARTPRQPAELANAASHTFTRWIAQQVWGISPSEVSQSLDGLFEQAGLGGATGAQARESLLDLLIISISSAQSGSPVPAGDSADWPRLGWALQPGSWLALEAAKVTEESSLDLAKSALRIFSYMRQVSQAAQHMLSYVMQHPQLMQQVAHEAHQHWVPPAPASSTLQCPAPTRSWRAVASSLAAQAISAVPYFAGLPRNAPNEVTLTSALTSMQYTHGVVLETLRTANLTRRLAGHMQTSAVVDGWYLPAAWPAWLDVLSVHYDPSIWHMPALFEPSRYMAKPDLADELLTWGVDAACPAHQQVHTLLHMLVTEVAIAQPWTAAGAAGTR